MLKSLLAFAMGCVNIKYFSAVLHCNLGESYRVKKQLIPDCC